MHDSCAGSISQRIFYIYSTAALVWRCLTGSAQSNLSDRFLIYTHSRPAFRVPGVCSASKKAEPTRLQAPPLVIILAPIRQALQLLLPRNKRFGIYTSISHFFLAVA